MNGKGYSFRFFIPKTSRSLYLLLLTISIIAFCIELLLLASSDSVSVFSELFHLSYHCLIYIVGLFLLKHSDGFKNKVSFALGCIQILFGIIVCIKSFTHIFDPHEPHHVFIASVGFLALITTYLPYVLISHFQKQDIYIYSCKMCLRNDFLFKLVFFVVALATYYFQSKTPDIVLGFLQAFLLMQAGWLIIKGVKPPHQFRH